MYVFFPVLFSAVAYIFGWDGVDAFFWGIGAWIIWMLVVLTVKVIGGIHYTITERRRERERAPEPDEVR